MRKFVYKYCILFTKHRKRDIEKVEGGKRNGKTDQRYGKKALTGPE
jgi:hypothetical protein